MKITTERIMSQLDAMDSDLKKGPDSTTLAIYQALKDFENGELCKEILRIGTRDQNNWNPSKAVKLALGLGIHIGYLLSQSE